MADEAKQWDGKSRGGSGGYRFFVFIVRLFGIRMAYCFLALIVIYFIPFAPKATRAIWCYNRRHRGLGVWRSLTELYAHYYTFGQILIDKIAMKGGLAERYHFTFDETYDRFLNLLNGGQGVVMLGAHVGCWEAGAGFFGSYGKKINVVMWDAEHRQIKEVLSHNAKRENDYNIIAINQDAVAAMLQIKIALDRGEYVCFNGDRYVDRHAAKPVSLLGATAYLPLGPFRIAAKCGVPVVFYYAVREPDFTYRFVFEMPVWDGRATADMLLERYAQSLTDIVGQYPRQWFNFYDFWKDDHKHEGYEIAS